MIDSRRALSLMGLLCMLFLAFRTDLAHTPDAIAPDGGRYFGPMVGGKFDGRGRIEWGDGSVYSGEFANGLMSGHGRLVASTGTVYVGQFKSGLFSGAGELVFENGTKYKGVFARGQFHGKGRYEDTDGDIYEGDFERDEFTGNGTHTNKAGAHRTGQFEKWRQHGAGTHISADGTLYEGEFVRGMYSGEGTLKYAKAGAGERTEERGIWREGKFEALDEELQTQRNVELSLSMQGSLLDEALAALAPSDPARINMYLLAVAGDGAEESFRREVQRVRDQFDRDLGTRGRSIALINSRTTAGTAPMATITSIGRSLKTIASRMDLEKDILFVFLNSHGSKDHKLVLDQNGMDLRDLPANELGALIRETGIRWKVVVVSACYSGGFIEALGDSRTMILTSARRDRNSFGGSDQSDFTFFGRAFFKEALPSTPSFATAFSKAKGLIKEWEARGFKRDEVGPAEHRSFPQMHNPPAIEHHLKQWRAQIPAPAALLATIK